MAKRLCRWFLSVEHRPPRWFGWWSGPQAPQYSSADSMRPGTVLHTGERVLARDAPAAASQPVSTP
jgi:hypothetical protein